MSAAFAMLTTHQGLQASISDIQLPKLGEPADAAMSPREEYEIGARITAQIHSAGYALEDPELVEYITRLGWHIASHSRDLPEHLQFFMVRDPRINAFALPGGFMGFNAGLLMAAESESELAGVMAHELAHVTQRHIARTMEGTRVADIATWAAVLAAIIAGSAAPDVVLGALSLGQAATLQRQINYTRNHELEADRIGIGTMMSAGFDPAGMVSFFQRLEQQSRLYGSGMPEILRTHPVNTTRIAEARARAQRQSDGSDAERPLTFQLMRARARVLTAERPSAALDHFRRRLERTSDDPAEHYGAALALHLWRTSQPHMAELGQMPGTEHFRNVRRHPVITSPRVLSIRVDESLYFANARRTEDAIYDMALNCDGRRHVVLLCSAINHIDASALDSLESLNRRLLDAGVTLHLSEVKGPVMDQLKRSDFLRHLRGEVFMTHYQALAALDAETSERASSLKPQAASRS